MRIGLLRHHKVRYPFPRKLFLSGSEIKNWFDAYDLADIDKIHVDGSQVKWDVCLSSPQKRALLTARDIFAGEIEVRDELMELDAGPFLHSQLKLPFLVWAMWIRWKTMSDHPAIRDFRDRIQSFVHSLGSLEVDDVLIVSHGLVMTFLQDELKRRGYAGESFRAPAYGRIYIFEKQGSEV